MVCFDVTLEKKSAAMRLFSLGTNGLCLCACVSVCVFERERERKRDIQLWYFTIQPRKHVQMEMKMAENPFCDANLAL